jgi:hypothetical protein
MAAISRFGDAPHIHPCVEHFKKASRDGSHRKMPLLFWKEPFVLGCSVVEKKIGRQHDAFYMLR